MERSHADDLHRRTDGSVQRLPVRESDRERLYTAPNAELAEDSLNVRAARPPVCPGHPDHRLGGGVRSPPSGDRLARTGAREQVTFVPWPQSGGPPSRLYGSASLEQDLGCGRGPAARPDEVDRAAKERRIARATARRLVETDG